MVCFEGNAGFAEIGTCNAPLEHGYSVLAWNHPGFGSSEGWPHPDQETDAVEVVMTFARDRLNFSAEQTLLLGWSIGGFSNTWAAKSIPRISGVVCCCGLLTLDGILLRAVALASMATTASRTAAAQAPRSCARVQHRRP